MGNTQSNSAPTTLLQCVDQETGELDPMLHGLYARNLREAASEEDFIELIAICELIAEAEMNDPTREPPRKPREKSSGTQRFYRAEDGSLQPIGPYQTSWYRDYVIDPKVDNKRFQKKFRRRFRMSFESFHRSPTRWTHTGSCRNQQQKGWREVEIAATSKIGGK